MNRCTAILLFLAPFARANEPYDKVALAANEKLVKLFGAGGYRGAESFGTGVIVSAEGHILTAAAPFLDGRELRLHLPDGRKYPFKVLMIEPEFDAAVVQIVEPKKGAIPLDLPFFDLAEAVKTAKASPGDLVMALSNMYKVAERDEMMSVQRAQVTAVGKLSARRGQFEVPFHGEVLYLDTVTNNPGAAGGAVINRKGELLGLIGKEFRNNQTDTWVNYAMPLTAKAEFVRKGEKKSYTLVEFAKLVIDGKWEKSPPREDTGLKTARVHTGIVFVPKVVDRTPPYIEAIEPKSPAALAGLKSDDLVIYFDGEPVYSTDVFKDLLKRYNPGDKVQIEIRRGDVLTAVSLELAPLPKK